jgi:hypothetical protein
LLAWPSGTAWARVDVYVGFLDEEVAGVLPSVIANNPNRRVIVLDAPEPGGASGDMLFDKSMSDYAPNSPPRIVTLADLDDEYDGAKKQHPHAGNTPDAFESQVLNNVAAPEGLSMIEYNPSAPEKDPIFVLLNTRGAFPDSAESMLMSRMQELRTLGDARTSSGGINVSVFGTAGGVAASAHPGTILPVVGSVSVGSTSTSVHLPPILEAAPKIYPPLAPPLNGNMNGDPGDAPGGFHYFFGLGGGRPQQLPMYAPQAPQKPHWVDGGYRFTYHAEVSLVDSQRGGASLFFDRDFGSEDEANNAAQQAFVHADDLVASSGPFRGLTLRQAIAKVSKEENGTVSLTTDFFAGQSVKSAAAQYGITNVNMEDYLVLHGLVGQVNSVHIDRLVTDPPVITPEFTKQFQAWCANASYTPDQYADALTWGAYGRVLPMTPTSSSWNLFNNIDSATASTLVFAPKVNQHPTIVDPFYADIADAFIQSAVKGGLFELRDVLDPSAQDKLSKSSLRQLQTLLEDKNAAIANQTRQLIAAINAKGATYQQIHDQAKLLVAQTMSLDIPPGPLRNELTQVLGKSGNPTQKSLIAQGQLPIMQKNADGSAMQVWIRPGQWDTDQIFLSQTHLNGSMVDRALYRSSMVLATQAQGPSAVNIEMANMDRAATLARVYDQNGDQNVVQCVTPPDQNAYPLPIVHYQ